jgi:hypothetical protein
MQFRCLHYQRRLGLPQLQLLPPHLLLHHHLIDHFHYQNYLHHCYLDLVKLTEYYQHRQKS